MEEGDLGGCLFVEKCVGKNLYNSKLTHRKFCGAELLLVVENADLGTRWYIIEYTLLHLGFLLSSIFIHYCLGESLQASYTNIDGSTCQIIFIYNTQLLRETEKDFLICFLIWEEIERGDFGAGLLCALEHGFQSGNLFV